MINQAVGNLLQSIYDSFSRISERAGRISRFGQEGDTESLVSDIVGNKLDEFQVKASAKAIKSIDDTENSVLDILA